jgi:hypothetical protein
MDMMIAAHAETSAAVHCATASMFIASAPMITTCSSLGNQAAHALAWQVIFVVPPK